MLGPILERIGEFLYSLWRQHERATVFSRSQQKLSKIVITRQMVNGSFFAVCVGGTWFGLMNKDDWLKLEHLLRQNLPKDDDAPKGLLPSLDGIPVVEDEALARRILVDMSMNGMMSSDEPTAWQKIDDYLTEGMRKLRGEK